MSIFQCLTDSFVSELWTGVHNLQSHTFKLALYNSSASLGSSTTAYSSTNEITGTGYSAGGATLSVSSGCPQVSGTRIVWTFDKLTISTLTASDIKAGMIYNSSASNKAVAVLNFGTAQSKTAANLSILFPSVTDGGILNWAFK